MKTENCSSHVPKPLLTNDKSNFINDRKRLQKRQESALQPSENHQEDDRKPSQGRQKATTRTTGSYHEDEKCLHAAIKNKLRDGLHRAALFTFYFSLFTSRRDCSSLPKGPLFTLHFSLFTSRRDRFSLPEGSRLDWFFKTGERISARCSGDRGSGECRLPYRRGEHVPWASRADATPCGEA